MRLLHPRHGPHQPRSALPPRRPGSVRRTTTHDSCRPDGLEAPVHVTAIGRDLITALDGSTAVLDQAVVSFTHEASWDRTITDIELSPADGRASALLGVRAGVGFRTALDQALPGERGSGSVRYQLLDDIPTAVLVAGHALSALDTPIPETVDRDQLWSAQADLCAGWATGATIMLGIAEKGRPPMTTGPVAPPVHTDDPMAWHDLRPLAPHDMRRARLIDVWRAGGFVEVEGFLRDSHCDVDGVETIVHEYTVRARLDPSTATYVWGEATIGALPWEECPGAAASASRLAGLPAANLRPVVRETFVGTSTCTHLNDTLRALEDVPALARLLLG